MATGDTGHSNGDAGCHVPGDGTTAAPGRRRWRWLADAAVIVAVLLTLSTLLSEGVRRSTPWGTISVRGWARPLSASLLLIAFQLVLMRDQWLGARVRRLALRLWRTPDVQSHWPIWLATRLGVLAVGFLGIAIIGYAPHTPPYWEYPSDLLNMPARWDTGWYLGIARDGYRYDASATGNMQNIAFFPLLPLLMRAGAFVVGPHPLWIAMVLSVIAFGGATVYLARLARHWLDADGAYRAVVLVSTYPFAVFFSAAYTESIFLLATIGACYHAQRADWRWVAVWGFAAGLSRPNGAFLSVVLALIAWAPILQARWSTRLRALVAVVSPLCGTVLFSAYIWSITGNPLQWAFQHAAWGRVYRGLWGVLAEQGVYVTAHGLERYWLARPVDGLHLAVLAFVLGTVWPVTRRLGLAYGALVVVFVGPPLLMGGLLSLGRLSATLFPIFIWLAGVVDERRHVAVVTVFAMLQGLCAIAFFTWRPFY